MSYLNQPYQNNFQELCAAMPVFYLDVLEMRAILRAQGYLLDGICGGVENVVDFNFILTADNTTIRMWEKVLKITYENALTLEQRKRVVIGYIIGLGHIGEQEIREIVALYTDFAISVTFQRGVIGITLDGVGFISGYTNLIETLAKRIPAHLSLGFTVNVRSPTATTLHIGGSIGASIRLGLPPGEDTYNFRRTLPTGGRGGVQSSLGIQEDTAPPPGTTILRTGGVCTILSNLSKGE